MHLHIYMPLHMGTYTYTHTHTLTLVHHRYATPNTHNKQTPPNMTIKMTVDICLSVCLGDKDSAAETQLSGHLLDCRHPALLPQ